MTGDRDESVPLSEQEVREVVREELQRQGDRFVTRRGLLGAVGVSGAAGLAGGYFLDGRQTASAPEETRDASSSSTRQPPTSGREVGDPGGGSGDRGYLAGPGDVQSTLRDALGDGVSRVVLVNGATYELDSSVEVPPGVALDCSGSYVDVTADTNVFELHSQSQVVNPRVRTTRVDGYSSTIFHVFPGQFGERFGTERAVPVWTVSGGWSEMTPGEGTCVELRGLRENPDREYDARRDSRNVFFCFISHNCIGGYRFAHLHREGGETTRGGHVNGNVVNGFAAGTTRFVETDDTATGTNMVNGNKFHLATQPGVDAESEWLWYANKGTRNELWEWGDNWDYGRYGDSDGDGYAESWYIGPDAGMNFVWRKQDSASGGLGSTVVDDSDGASGSRYLLLERLGVPVQNLEVWDDAE